MNKVKIAMLDPEDKSNPLKTEKNINNIEMDVQSFEECITGIESIEEVNTKTIKYLEKIIRKSYEYRQYINYLKNELDITHCALVPNLNIKDLNVSLEFHHYPLTLYDIVEIILNKQLEERKDINDKISMFDVMEETMKEHYSGHVGLVPLSKTMHELAHSGAIRIPFSAVYGSTDLFVTNYKSFMRPDLIEKTQNAKLITDENSKEMNKDKLNKQVTHLNIKYNKENED